jgi:pimeloyl-ACP methyl ester carboxylesterase
MKAISQPLAGLAQLITTMGNEVTQVVQDMHGAIANPFGVRGEHYEAAPTVYGLIRYGLRQAGQVAALAGLAGDPDRDLRDSLDLQSIVNGVFGQLLAQQDSDYALPMTLLPKPPSLERDALIVFIHGLCLNESCWRHPAATDFMAWAGPHLDAQVRTLRYNTGRHISDNGLALADLLDSLALPSRLILIGHSMGGLVARSALHQGRERGDTWVERLSHLACLGSPHQGAVLERLGNQANRLLGATPYSRPLMRLGNLRSDGIRDLRFGYVIENQWRDRPVDEPRPNGKVPLDPLVRQLFLAGSISEAGSPSPRGDWLVRVDSALGSRLYDDAANLERCLFHRMGHMAMLEDPRTYQCLKEWLGHR